jgi:hypothetical protein
VVRGQDVPSCPATSAMWSQWNSPRSLRSSSRRTAVSPTSFAVLRGPSSLCLRHGLASLGRHRPPLGRSYHRPRTQNLRTRTYWRFRGGRPWQYPGRSHRAQPTLPVSEAVEEYLHWLELDRHASPGTVVGDWDEFGCFQRFAYQHGQENPSGPVGWLFGIPFLASIGRMAVSMRELPRLLA